MVVKCSGVRLANHRLSTLDLFYYFMQAYCHKIKALKLDFLDFKNLCKVQEETKTTFK